MWFSPSIFALLGPSSFAVALPGFASTFAGAPVSAVFPPPGSGRGTPNSSFPDASEVGFLGPTPTGDEAIAIETAPSVPKWSTEFPLVKPGALNRPVGSDPDFDVLQNLGSLSPWQSVDSFGLPKSSAKLPQGCSITQVHLLHRHGARYPTAGSFPSAFAAKLNAAAETGNLSASGALSFLDTWTYKLGEEILTPYGRGQLYDLGVNFRIRYGDLLKGFSDLPVFRTTSEERMVDSALQFAAGFFGVQSYQQDYHQLIMIESGGQNNTLAPYENCANANNDIGNLGNVEATKWANLYLQPTLKRLSPLLKGFQLTVTDLLGMQQLCAYETVALGFSQFCGLFTENEWKSYEYYIDIQFWYGNGPGNPTSSAQGIGYVQELVSRLTHTPITVFDSAVNASIVTNPVLFPLNQPIYVDASHDTVMSTIYVAMNLTSLAGTKPLPLDHIPENRKYVVSKLAPFSVNFVGQVLSCPASGEPTHIRWVLNDAVVPLTGIDGCKANADGLCELQTFIKGMQQRIQEVDFNFDCFGNYSVQSVPLNIIDGQFPASLRP